MVVAAAPTMNAAAAAASAAVVSSPSALGSHTGRAALRSTAAAAAAQGEGAGAAASECPGRALGSAALALGLAGALAGGRRSARRGALAGRRPLAAPRAAGSVRVVLAAAAVADVAAQQAPAAEAEEKEPPLPRGRPLQIVKIDIESNSVILGEEEIQELERALKRSGHDKVAVVGVMGAFRTGKSFLLDLMLRYMREKSQGVDAQVDGEECPVPDWVLERGVPAWAVKCGDSLVEGREGRDMEAKELDGFQWRPGMEKCTEGVWIWSEVFTAKAGDEEVAVLLMDTQGAWDARMTKEQSATVFGLTTLLASRLVYNVSKQIQQDKIDNLLYFTEFAQAALRSKNGFASLENQQVRPFQTLDFLIRDWPHYPESVTIDSGRTMMNDHLGQYMDKKVSEDTQSIDTLQQMFSKLDIWCLPHPSLAIERESWNGDLKVIEPQFWKFIDTYLDKIFSPSELQAKTTLGTPLTVDTFANVLREFVFAFKNASPKAQSFAEAMETSNSLLARDSALKFLKNSMKEQIGETQALAPAEFEKLALAAAEKAEAEFKTKAIYGNEDNIQRVALELKGDVKTEIERLREENQRKLEASLNGLSDVSLAAVAGFGLDKVSDFTCDWWSPFCRDISGDLLFGYTGVLLYVAFSVFSINSKRGQLDAMVAAIELGKSMTKKASKLLGEVKTDFGKNDEGKP